MYKEDLTMSRIVKAGITVCITLFVVGFIVLMATNYVSNKKRLAAEQAQQQQMQQVEQQETPVPEEKPVDNQSGNKTSDNTGTEGNSEQTQTVQPTVSEGASTVKEDYTYTLLTEDNVNSLIQGTEQTEIVLVAKKGVVLLTDNKKNTRQLMYSLDMMTTDGNSLSYYVSENVYNSVQVGDKLNLTYSVHTNKNNVEFPVIKNVAVVE